MTEIEWMDVTTELCGYWQYLKGNMVKLQAYERLFKPYPMSAIISTIREIGSKYTNDNLPKMAELIRESRIEKRDEKVFEWWQLAINAWKLEHQGDQTTDEYIAADIDRRNVSRQKAKCEKAGKYGYPWSWVWSVAEWLGGRACAIDCFTEELIYIPNFGNIPMKERSKKVREWIGQFKGGKKIQVHEENHFHKPESIGSITEEIPF